MIETAIAVEAETLTCGECGIVFSVPKWWVDERRRDHKGWSCPNGHGRVFQRETKEEKRIRELELKLHDAGRVGEQAFRDLELEKKARQQVQRRLSATKGVLTRTKNRLARGQCPCCEAIFPDLEAHLADAHPEYEGTDDPEEEP
jgi:hypothetical protein